jgi:phosphate/phosphite/phosphonate ABC transporter binding protein
MSDERDSQRERTLALGQARRTTTPSEERGPFAEPLVAGRYRLLHQIGAGGMGTVWEAEHVELRSRVAVKLLGQFGERADAVARFTREARAAASVRHDHVALVTDFGTDPAVGPFLVMELMQGETVMDLLDRVSVLPIDLALRIGAQVADGLATIHAAGIVHRDLKPPNVFLVPIAEGRTRAKILDFGIAQVEVDDDVITQGVVVGTPVYMAPELFVEGARADSKSDLYALGVLLYRMISGEHPHRGTGPELLKSILTTSVRPLRDVRQDVPEPVNALVLSLLHTDPTRRPLAAADVRDRLQELAGGRGIRTAEVDALTRPPGAVRSSMPTRPAGVPAEVASSATDRRSGKSKLVAAGIVAVGVSIAGYLSLAPVLDSSPTVVAPPLRYAVSRYVDADRVRAQHQPLAEAISHALHRPVQIDVVEDFAPLTGPLARGEIQLAALSPLSYVELTAQGVPIEVVARAVSAAGETYSGLILTRHDADIRSLTDLRGRVFCYVSPTSTSGFLYPRAVLRAAGLDPDADFRATRFTGDHVSALRALAHHACDGAAVFSGILHDADQHGMEPESFRVLGTTDPIPYDAYVVPNSLDSDTRLALGRALLSLSPGSAEARPLGAAGGDLRGFVAADDRDWDRVRQVVRDNAAPAD